MENENQVKVSKDTRTIYLHGSVNKNSALKFIKSIKEMELKNPDKNIDVFINSYGGHIADMLAMYEIVRNLHCYVNTHGMGSVCSAGAFLLAIGTGERYAYTHSRYMIHELSAANWGSFTDMDVYHKELKRVQRQLNEILADVTGNELKRIKQDVKRDKWMNAKEAVNYGLADQVL